MYAATLLLIVFGPLPEPIVLTYPQPNLATCWSERNTELAFGIMRSNGFQVHALCLPEGSVSNSHLHAAG